MAAASFTNAEFFLNLPLDEFIEFNKEMAESGKD